MALIEYKEDELKQGIAAASESLAEKEVIQLNINDEFSIYPVLDCLKRTSIAAGLNELQIHETEIAVRELVSNIIRHGGGRGQVRFILDASAPNEIAIEVEDWGKGIGNFFEALEDGFSTGGGLGGGLPAVNRLMDSFKLVSRPNSGALFHTVKKAFTEPIAEEAIWKFSVFSRPAVAESENGDGFFLKRRGSVTYIFLIDGLGHGFDAHFATEKALKNIENAYNWQENELIELLHRKLKATRGVVIGMAMVDDKVNTIRYTGIGNITGIVIGKQNATFLNYNGTLGGKLDHYKTFEYPYHNGDAFVLHSDGISSGWTKKFAELWNGNVQVLAQNIFNKYRREGDDATIIVGTRK